uniref:Uncharacterized protein n=1 Tax=Octopus bimaculoides TaxID=37653 RepID=A0A0L8G3F9_OCTBM
MGVPLVSDATKCSLIIFSFLYSQHIHLVLSSVYVQLRNNKKHLQYCTHSLCWDTCYAKISL